MTGVGLAQRRTRTGHWWVRTVLMAVIPLTIGVIGARRIDPAVGVGLGILALIGAVFVFHPDDLGWTLSLNRFWVDSPDARPSHAWQVWARISGLFLLVICAAGAILYSPPVLGPDCVQQSDGTIYCGPQPSFSQP